MSKLDNLKAVATKTELYTISVEFRTFIDEYNAQPMENYIPIEEMFDADVTSLMSELQGRTHHKFGGSGMVLSKTILSTMGLKTNHWLLDS